MKLATTLLLGFLVSAAALAHPGGDGDRSGRRGPPVDRLAEHLGLDAYQTQQVEEILGASRSKGMEIMMAAREETRAKMALVHTDTVEQLRTVLSEEQVQQFEELTQRFRERGFGPRGRHRGHDRQDDPDAGEAP